MRHDIVPDKYFPDGIAEEITPVVLVRRGIGLALFALLTMGIIGFFSASPAYHHLKDGEAVIKVSFSHAGDRVAKCHKRTRAELAKLAPNMRAAMSCPRERNPVLLVITLDGKEIYRETAAPKGLSNDGASIFYQRMTVPAGEHQIYVQMRDSNRTEGFDYVYNEKVDLAAGRNFVIDFDESIKNFKVY